MRKPVRFRTDRAVSPVGNLARPPVCSPEAVSPTVSKLQCCRGEMTGDALDGKLTASFTVTVNTEPASYLM